jgi:dipicolinate synthase subunit B
MNNKNIGFAITGSFCTFKKILPCIKKLVEQGNNIIPIFSYSVINTDTRFYKAVDFARDIEDITGNKPIATLTEVEPIGPNNNLDIMIIAPCTGNTLAKLNNAITDTPVLMASKAHLRNNKPLLIAVSTNDALSNNAKNFGELLIKKNIFFVPFAQDDCIKKCNSLIADYELIDVAADSAIIGKQLQPLLKRN